MDPNFRKVLTIQKIKSFKGILTGFQIWCIISYREKKKDIRCDKKFFENRKVNLDRAWDSWYN